MTDYSHEVNTIMQRIAKRQKDKENEYKKFCTTLLQRTDQGYYQSFIDLENCLYQMEVIQELIDIMRLRSTSPNSPQLKKLDALPPEFKEYLPYLPDILETKSILADDYEQRILRSDYSENVEEILHVARSHAHDRFIEDHVQREERPQIIRE